MDFDLTLKEYGVNSKELASITAMNILSQIGLKVAPRDVVIEDLELFQSKIPEIINDTKFHVTDYQYETKDDDSLESRILKELEYLENYYPHGEVPINTLHKKLMKENDAANNLLIKECEKGLVQKGLIYMPTGECFKRIEYKD